MKVRVYNQVLTMKNEQNIYIYLQIKSINYILNTGEKGMQTKPKKRNEQNRNRKQKNPI